MGSGWFKLCRIFGPDRYSQTPRRHQSVTPSDVIPPEVPRGRGCVGPVAFGRGQRTFLYAPLRGLVRTASSDYWRPRAPVAFSSSGAPAATRGRRFGGMQRLEIGRWFVALVFRLLARALAERFFEFSRTVILLQDIGERFVSKFLNVLHRVPRKQMKRMPRLGKFCEMQGYLIASA